MIRISRSVCRAAAAALSLAGFASCAALPLENDTYEPIAATSLGKDFGNATAHNAAQHIVDPVPANVLSGAPALDGDRAAAAYRRYRTGTVIVPASVETTDFGTDR